MVAVFAAVAILLGSDGAATTAFVLLAGLFGLLAASGVVPVKIKHGETELHTVAKRATETVDLAALNMGAPALQLTAAEADADVRLALEQGWANEAELVGALAASQRLREHLNFEVRTTELVREAAERIGLQIEAERPINGSDARADLSITTSNGNALYVEIKLAYNSFARAQISDILRSGANLLMLVESLPKGMAGNVGMLQKLRDRPGCIISRPEPALLDWELRYLTGRSGGDSPPGDVIVVSS
jgi:hypothetical protein